MRIQLIIYILLILLFVIYNQFLRVEDAKLNAIINIIFASFLFLYMGYFAYTLLQKTKRKK